MEWRKKMPLTNNSFFHSNGMNHSIPIPKSQTQPSTHMQSANHDHRYADERQSELVL